MLLLLPWNKSELEICIAFGKYRGEPRRESESSIFCYTVPLRASKMTGEGDEIVEIVKNSRGR